MTSHQSSDVIWPPPEPAADSPIGDDIMARLRLRATLTGQAEANQLKPVKGQLGGGWTARLRYLIRPRQALVALTALLVLTVGAMIGAWWQGRAVAESDGQAVPGLVLTPVASELEPLPAAGRVPEAGTPGGSAGLTVDVAGAVARPGLVHLAAGARVDDAVRAAGGPTASAEITLINLARLLSDGEQVYVPQVGETPRPVGLTGAAGESSGPATTTALIDINQADAAGLQTLPGIGPVLAGRIIEHRTTSGPFGDVEALSQVAGIGPALMDRLRALVTVS